MEFTYAELNALNKVLGSVKYSKELDSDDLDFLATSPIVCSAYEKIKIEYLKGFNKHVEEGKIVHFENSQYKPSMHTITKKHSAYREIKERLSNLGSNRKNEIKALSDESKLEYTKLLFAPCYVEKEIFEEVYNLVKKI